MYFKELVEYLKSSQFQICLDQIIIASKGNNKEGTGYHQLLKQYIRKDIKRIMTPKIKNFNYKIEALKYYHAVYIQDDKYKELLTKFKTNIDKSEFEKLFNYYSKKYVYFTNKVDELSDILKRNEISKISINKVIEYTLYNRNNQKIIYSPQNGFNIFYNDYYTSKRSLLSAIVEILKSHILSKDCNLTDSQIEDLIKKSLFVKSFEVSIYLSPEISSFLFSKISNIKNDNIRNYKNLNQTFYLNKNGRKTPFGSKKIFYNVTEKERLNLDTIFKLEVVISNKNHYFEEKINQNLFDILPKNDSFYTLLENDYFKRILIKQFTPIFNFLEKDDLKELHRLLFNQIELSNNKRSVTKNITEILFNHSIILSHNNLFYQVS